MIVYHLFMLALGVFFDVAGIHAFRKIWRKTEDANLRFQSLMFLIAVNIGAGFIIGDALRGLFAAPPM